MILSAFDKLRVLLEPVDSFRQPGIGLHLGQLEFYDNPPSVSLPCLKRALQQYPKMECDIQQKESYLAYLGFDSSDFPTLYPHCESTMGSRNAIYSLLQKEYLDAVSEGLSSRLRFVLPDPGYPLYEGVVSYLGATKVNYEVDKEDPADNAVERIVKGDRSKRYCVVICNPMMPQSDLYSAEYIDTVLKLVAEQDVRLIVDECYREFADESELYSPLASIAGQTFNNRSVVFLHTLSKRSGLPGLRSGFAFGTLKSIQNISEFNKVSGSKTNDYFSELSANAWKETQPESVERIKRNWELARTILGGGSSNEWHENGMFLWLKVDDDERFVSSLWQKSAVKVMPGSYLSASGKYKDYVRIALNQREEVMTYCLKEIASLLNGLR